MTGEFVCHAILFRIVGNSCCMDQDVCLCSRRKPQPQGFFDAKMQAVDDDDTDAAANATERYLMSPIAYLNNPYLKWLIYSAAFNEPFAEPLGAMRVQFYLDWMIPFSAGKADIIRRRLFEALEICYARFPVCRKRGPRGCSLLVVRSRAADPSFGRRFTARRSQNQGTGPWTSSWSRCWPPCWGAQGS